jgi:hypothetical protein
VHHFRLRRRSAAHVKLELRRQLQAATPHSLPLLLHHLLHVLLLLLQQLDHAKLRAQPVPATQTE